MRLIKIVILLVLSAALFCHEDSLLEKAKYQYKIGHKEKAKELFTEAAKQGSAEAHYLLGYEFALADKERTQHFVEAAKMGYQDALPYALEDLLFRAGDLWNANPRLALEVYKEAKQKNPSLKLYDEKNTVETLELCAQAPPFNVENFARKYAIKRPENSFYYVWELAEEASRGGRFGKPDPELVFQLVIRGGVVPAEFELAVKDTYKNWKEKKAVAFDLCQYVGSGYGMGYCATRGAKQSDKDFERQWQAFAGHYDKALQKQIHDAHNAAMRFLEEKVWGEEGNDGSGYVAWATESLTKQKQEFFKFTQKVATGYKPAVRKLDDSDKELNQVYRQVIHALKDKPISGGHFQVTEDTVRKDQLLWIQYRDRVARMYTALNSGLTLADWKSLLTDERVAGLKAILELKKMYE